VAFKMMVQEWGNKQEKAGAVLFKQQAHKLLNSSNVDGY